MSSAVNIYSSQPLRSSQLACALLSLETLGMPVQLLPLEQLPSPQQQRLGARRAELEQVCIRLATIGEVLDAHEIGKHRLDAGVEQGLLAERESLQSRKRALEVTVAALQKGGQANG